MPQLVRLPDWQPRLVALVNERRLVPYAYGENDCWHFARAGIEAMTGTLLFPEMTPYRGWVGAAKMLIANGWETVEDGVTALLGPPIDPNESRPGDVVSYEAVGDRHLAMRVGDAALTPSLEGLTVIERARWCRAWSVG
jgi:hypothetical protein